MERLNSVKRGSKKAHMRNSKDWHPRWVALSAAPNDSVEHPQMAQRCCFVLQK